MPMREEDLARLPPMTPIAEVAEQQRLEDLKAFRSYLADSGVVKCLVQLYQHVAKHEMRLDNPAVVREFLAAYTSEHPDAVEAAQLERENATLAEYNSVLAAQIEELEADVSREREVVLGRRLWRRLADEVFWTAAPGGQVPPPEGLTLGQLYLRLCGCERDARAKCVLVDILRPPEFSGAQASVVITEADFVDWVARDMAEDLREWCREELLPRLGPEPPFEAELLRETRACALYPDGVKGGLANLVELPPRLVTFLESAARQPGRYVPPM